MTGENKGRTDDPVSRLLILVARRRAILAVAAAIWESTRLLHASPGAPTWAETMLYAHAERKAVEVLAARVFDGDEEQTNWGELTLPADSPHEAWLGRWREAVDVALAVAWALREI